MRFPTDMKLLWESIEWLYRHICQHCRELGIRRPRNKYTDVAASYLSKQHYSLSKVKARNRKTEILWIFFGIHTANAILMIDKIKNRQKKAV